jgi:hypothetical protein
VVLSQRLGALSTAALARPEREPPCLRRVAGGASANDDDGVPACGGHHRFGAECGNYIQFWLKRSSGETGQKPFFWRQPASSSTSARSGASDGTRLQALAKPRGEAAWRSLRRRWGRGEGLQRVRWYPSRRLVRVSFFLFFLKVLCPAGFWGRVADRLFGGNRRKTAIPRNTKTPTEGGNGSVIRSISEQV